jgi:DNA-binding XRE family transcriptional regulator
VERTPAPRRSAEFVPLDFGVRAAKAVCDRFGAQVVDYTASGLKGSITLRIPSRRERFAMSMERYQAALAGAAEVRRQTVRALEVAEQRRQANRALRRSLAELRQSLQEARMESLSIVGSIPSARGKNGDRTT